jgi:hypothetical protein
MLRVRFVAPATARVRFVLAQRGRPVASTTRSLRAGQPITLRFELDRPLRGPLRIRATALR